ncbi:MAG: YchJ family protein [Bacteriovoracaceae bacterium]|jgi:SEC-C motif domain protein|nr:YchJ family protein [Bacteriovoracaceae bacterium]
MAICACGSGNQYKECCEKYITGIENAPTAELLMRSRYTAFTNGNIDYLFETHHESTQESLDRSEVEAWSRDSQWEGLTIKNIENGQTNDTSGSVEFIAEFRIGGVLQKHHENASFKKEEDGKWYFHDGKTENQPFARSGVKVGRNDPCICGSGKKFKKCCG